MTDPTAGHQHPFDSSSHGPSVSLRRHGDEFYLTGTVPCVCWRRQADRWRPLPRDCPAAADPVEVQDLPDDLREELLAFIARARVMAPARWDRGN